MRKRPAEARENATSDNLHVAFIVATAVAIEVRRVAVQHTVITTFWRRPWWALGDEKALQLARPPPLNHALRNVDERLGLARGNSSRDDFPARARQNWQRAVVPDEAVRRLSVTSI
jgi:hypothetical protein